MEEFIMTKEGIDALIGDVAGIAAKDYVDYRKLWHVANRVSGEPRIIRLEVQSEISRLLKYFYGPLYADVIKLEPDILIDMLDAEVDRWKSDKDEVDKFVRDCITRKERRDKERERERERIRVIKRA